MTPVEIVYAVGVLLLAYFVRGISGFGSGLVAVPLLALAFPLTVVVPLMLLLDFTASLVIGGLNFKQVRWDEVRLLMPLSLLGVVLGTSLLVSLPKEPLLIGLGVFVLIFALRSLLNMYGEKVISRWWAIPASLSGGTIGGLFGTGGPPYVIYLTHRIQQKGELRATFSGMFFLEGLFRIGSFVMAGLLADGGIWKGYAMGLPIALLALYVGSHVHTGLSNAQIKRVIGVLLLVSGLSLIVKAL